jgi:hypothetical protein
MVRITQKDILIIEAADLYYKQNIGEGLKEQSVFIDILLQLQTYLVQSQIAIPEYKNRISTLAGESAQIDHLIPLQNDHQKWGTI